MRHLKKKCAGILPTSTSVMKIPVWPAFITVRKMLWVRQIRRALSKLLPIHLPRFPASKMPIPSPNSALKKRKFAARMQYIRLPSQRWSAKRLLLMKKQSKYSRQFPVGRIPTSRFTLAKRKLRKSKQKKKPTVWRRNAKRKNAVLQLKKQQRSVKRHLPSERLLLRLA